MIYYLVEPVITISEHTLRNTIMSLAYPVMDLSILFAIITLYYLIRKNRQNRAIRLILGGLFLHVIGDSVYAYLDIMQFYYSGHSVSLLWLSSIWLIGFGGYFAAGDQEVTEKTFRKEFKKSETVIPYTSTVILMLLVIYSYNGAFNALSFGFLIITIMIIIRQLYVVKENNKLIEQYKNLAYHDPLTGLNNRASFHEHLQHMIGDPANETIGLLLIDLDRFKVINDTLGHQAGDSILLKTSTYLGQASKSGSKSGMKIFRIGGDEFVILLPKASGNDCVEVAEALLKKFQRPFFVKEHEVIVTSSIGISMYPKHGKTVEELFRYGDAAMYLAKDDGRNRYRFYDEELNQVMARRMKIENALRKGIEKNQFEVYYQPKVQLDTRQIIGMEALLRWNHPELGRVSPAEFIPIAEETGSIVPIGEWVLNTACRQNRIWRKKGLPALNVSVNVSVRQFQQGNFVAIIKKALEASQLNPCLLEIEITESIMQNTKKNVNILREISDMGVKISIDDFGTGYSSLYVIQELPINTIKLDKAFIAKIGDPKQQAMIKTMIELGNTLDLDVVAEGIENEYQLKVLIDSKCSLGQGYLFSEPVDSNRFEEILKGNILTLRMAEKKNDKKITGKGSIEKDKFVKSHRVSKNAVKNKYVKKPRKTLVTGK